MPSQNVLIVDDHVDLARSLATLLQCWGHVVHTAYDGRAALAYARSIRFDVVLLDIGLPGMSGFELAAALRREGAKAMRILSMTGFTQPSDALAAIDAGIDHHLIKPLDLGFLHSFFGRSALHA